MDLPGSQGMRSGEGQRRELHNVITEHWLDCQPSEEDFDPDHSGCCISLLCVSDTNMSWDQRNMNMQDYPPGN